MRPSHTDISSLIDTYDGLLFDSFGVLVDGVDALPGAVELVQRLNSESVNYFVVTNDAAKSIQSRVETFLAQGFDIPPHRIVNSGSLIAGYYSQNGLEGLPTLVLGNRDVEDYVIAAGGRLVEMPDPSRPDTAAEPDIVVVGHSGPYEWKTTLDQLLELISRRFLQGHPVRLVLPNPDFIYPNGPGAYKFGAAAFVDLLDRALLRLHGPNEQLTATRLGKPYSPIFDEAVKRAGPGNIVMIGDQLETDILGANRAGIASAVVATGISGRSRPEEFDGVPENLTPGYILTSLV